MFKPMYPLLVQVTSSSNVALIPSLNLHSQPHHHTQAGRPGDFFVPSLSPILFIMEYHSDKHRSRNYLFSFCLMRRQNSKAWTVPDSQVCSQHWAWHSEGSINAWGEKSVGYSLSSFGTDLEIYQIKPDSLCPQRSQICDHPPQRPGPG